MVMVMVMVMRIVLVSLEPLSGFSWSMPDTTVLETLKAGHDAYFTIELDTIPFFADLQRIRLDRMRMCPSPNAIVCHTPPLISWMNDIMKSRCFP